jgi:myo-inositol 2-dehydrogenase / D-chiro-inositol 1-dehydrogenase
MGTSDTVRVGILGAGFMGSAHAECYDLLDIPIAMIASRSPGTITGNRPGTRWSSDIEEVINDPEVDCIDITLPNHLHLPAALACIRAGKPFLIEKPLARNAAEAEQIVNAARSAGVTAVYGENVRFKPSMVRTKSIVDEGGLGKILLLRANEVHNGPFHSDWFWDSESTGGGAVIDMGIHGIFAMEWFMGSRVKRVYAEAGVLKWADKCLGETEDTAVIVLRFENGGMAELVVSWAIAGGIDVRLEVFGSAGTAYLDSARAARATTIFSESGYGRGLEEESQDRPHVSATRGWSWPAGDEWAEHGHLAEIRHFVRCAAGQETPICTLEDGWRALQVVDAIYRSVKTGAPALVGE